MTRVYSAEYPFRGEYDQLAAAIVATAGQWHTQPEPGSMFVLISAYEGYSLGRILISATLATEAGWLTTCYSAAAIELQQRDPDVCLARLVIETDYDEWQQSHTSSEPELQRFKHEHHVDLVVGQLGEWWEYWVPRWRDAMKRVAAPTKDKRVPYGPRDTTALGIEKLYEMRNELIRERREIPSFEVACELTGLVKARTAGLRDAELKKHWEDREWTKAAPNPQD
jgi:hypothetical protein